MDRPELLGTRLFDLSGRTAIVTGAGRGLGRVIALSLAAAGADVALSSRTMSEIEAVAQEIAALGRRATPIRADITNEASCEALVARAIEDHRRIDILVNNAGMNIRKPILELSLEEYRTVLDTNLQGYFLCARAAGRAMTEQGAGKIVNISSLLGTQALPNQVAYASSKGAIEMMTRVLAVEWAQLGVQVNAIAPAYMETEMTRPVREDAARNQLILDRTPMHRWGQPHEIAGAVIFLASGASDYVTGHTLRVDGGWCIA